MRLLCSARQRSTDLEGVEFQRKKHIGWGKHVNNPKTLTCPPKKSIQINKIEMELQRLYANTKNARNLKQVSSRFYQPVLSHLSTHTKLKKHCARCRKQWQNNISGHSGNLRFHQPAHTPQTRIDSDRLWVCPCVHSKLVSLRWASQRVNWTNQPVMLLAERTFIRLGSQHLCNNG